MKNRLFPSRFFVRPVCPEEKALEAEYVPLRKKLADAGLNEKELRRMAPGDRVAALEQARLDPYEFIYLAC